MRIFKTKALAKWTRNNGVSDDALIEAVDRAFKGLIDADLGGHVIKQRVARPGQGKRGGFRMLIGIGRNRAVYLFGFAENERDNISNNELLTLREIASGVLNASEENLAQALKDGTLIEVEHDEDSEKGKSKNKSPDK